MESTIGRRELLTGAAASALMLTAPLDGEALAKMVPKGRASRPDPWEAIRARCPDRYEPIWLKGVSPETAHDTVAKDKPAWPGSAYKVEQSDLLYIERNVRIPMRDGKIVYADLLRPNDGRRSGKLPVLISWSPYGKHQPHSRREGDGLDPAWISKYNVWENPSPDYFVGEHGYAMLVCDSRGSWGSEGDCTFFDKADAEGFYDAIEWAGTQPWSNGHVGTMGVSAYTMAQWRVAALNPPHLKAIVPWEGSLDIYRERNFRGGIRETNFIRNWSRSQTVSNGRIEDWLANDLAHSFADCYYAAKQPDLRKVTVPAFVGASWSDQGVHTRGTLEGYKLIGSPQKWLLVHGRNKWGTYASPEMREKQRIFYDHFLKQPGSELAKWPRVQLDVRDNGDNQAVSLRAEKEWPLARTRYEKLYLDANGSKLSWAPPRGAGRARYDTDTGATTSFDIKFDRDIELTGHSSVRLWVETPTERDMDIFVALQKLDVSGNLVGFRFASTQKTGPVALGWLRASHRALDTRCSTTQQPVHLHLREDKLSPGVAVPIDVEIWPSGTLFRKGETLRLLLRGSDIYDKLPKAATIIKLESQNKGMHVIHTGGTRLSYLTIPIIA